jgi:tetratricopeptide (TPR) repeat protein
MLPEILGCYQSHKQQRMGGGGGTGRDFTQRIEWLALGLGDARILLFPLADNKLPLPLSKSVSHEDFLKHFLPEPLVYNDRLAPAALVLSRLLGDVGDRLDQGALPEAERALYAVVLAALGASKHKDPPSAARAVLEAANAAQAGGDVQKQTINAFGIRLRKRKDFDTAIAYYRKALELAPGDERLLFNLARALFEKGDLQGCQSSLEEALAKSPDFAEARKFLRYLTRRMQALPDEDFPDISP